MIDLKELEVWFVTGSQQLYGPKALKQVAANSREIAGALGEAREVPVRVVFKPVIKSAEEATALCLEANGAPTYVVEKTASLAEPVSWELVRTTTRGKLLANGLTSGTKYWFRIAASGSAGQSPWSDPVGKVAP